MTNVDSVTTPYQNNDLMNAESIKNVENNDPISNNATTTIRN